MGNKYKVVEITLKTRNGSLITKNTLILVAINKIELNYSEPYISSHYVSFLVYRRSTKIFKILLLFTKVSNIYFIFHDLNRKKQIIPRG